MKASLVLGRSSVSMMLFVMSLFFTVVTHAQQLPADEIIGAWEAEDGSVKLDMYKAGPNSRHVSCMATRSWNLTMPRSSWTRRILIPRCVPAR